MAAASGLRARGLNLGVATMRKGEHCILHVDAQYGYGDAGPQITPSPPLHRPWAGPTPLAARPHSSCCCYLRQGYEL